MSWFSTGEWPSIVTRSFSSSTPPPSPPPSPSSLKHIEEGDSDSSSVFFAHKGWFDAEGTQENGDHVFSSQAPQLADHNYHGDDEANVETLTLIRQALVDFYPSIKLYARTTPLELEHLYFNVILNGPQSKAYREKVVWFTSEHVYWKIIGSMDLTLVVAHYPYKFNKVGEPMKWWIAVSKSTLDAILVEVLQQLTSEYKVEQ